MDIPPADRIPLDAPSLSGNERRYLCECIDSNWISWQGAFVGRTESFLANYCSTRHALTVVNGTYALVMALQALEIGPGDEVIVPAFTMSATAFAVTTVGAKCVWIDCAPRSLTLDVDDVARKITDRTRAVMAVHLYGHAVDMERLLAITEPRGIAVIEDVAEAFGASAAGRRVGGWGTIACHSFHNKIIACGEGGAITLNDDVLAGRLEKLRTPSPDNFDNELIALNNRMSNVAGAVALAQLERVDELISHRRAVAAYYDERFVGVKGLSPFPVRSHENCVYWRYSLEVGPEYRLTRDELVSRLTGQGIEVRPVFRLVTEHPHYKEDNPGPFLHAEKIAAGALDLPSSPTLTEDQICRVADAVLAPVG
jgi:perosamine synthetase